MVRYWQRIGLGMLVWILWSSVGLAQSSESSDLPLALVGERAALQDAVCAQDWEAAIGVTDRLLVLEGLPDDYRDEMTGFRSRLVDLQAAETILPGIPGCEEAEEEMTSEAQVVSDRLNDLAVNITSPLTQAVVRDMGTDNLLMIRGLCSVLENEEVENPFDLMVKTIEQSFFGTALLTLDELEDFQEGDREQQQAVVEYLSFMSIVGAMQFCPENLPIVEQLFDVDIPDAPTATMPESDEAPVNGGGV